jgi:hypothetical protein
MKALEVILALCLIAGLASLAFGALILRKRSDAPRPPVRGGGV